MQATKAYTDPKPQTLNSKLCMQATKAYTDRMKHVTTSDPDLLIGHLYTRYFADLFGGSMQVLAFKM